MPATHMHPEHVKGEMRKEERREKGRLPAAVIKVETSPLQPIGTVHSRS